MNIQIVGIRPEVAALRLAHRRETAAIVCAGLLAGPIRDHQFDTAALVPLMDEAIKSACACTNCSGNTDTDKNPRNGRKEFGMRRR